MAQFRPERLFLERAGKRWAHDAGLDRFAEVLRRKRLAPNSAGTPRRGNGLVAQYHAANQVERSYGGYGEARSTMLRDTYLAKSKKWTHLGIDFYVPARTVVMCFRCAKVLRIDCDKPERWGWGNRIFVRILGTRIVLVYAHLDPDILVREGQVIARRVLGRVGRREHNGGWFPHLHVQAMSYERYLEFLRNPRGFDGYGFASDLADFPDPLPYLS
jgi:hypothetical protein